MKTLNEIAYAVANTSGFCIALFKSREDAKSFLESQPDGYSMLVRSIDGEGGFSIYKGQIYVGEKANANN